jgi:uncharacterized membrane protein
MTNNIGYQLEQKLNRHSLFSIFKVYLYTIIISSGPWVITIISLLLVGFLGFKAGSDIVSVYQIIVTYLIALGSSLILTGLLQLPLTRYIADLIFAQREDEVVGTYFGAIFLSLLLGLIFGTPLFIWLFEGEDSLVVLGSLTTFLTLSVVWTASVIATSLKYYKEVVWAYFVSYFIIVILSYLVEENLIYLGFVYFLGNLILFTILTLLVIKKYPSTIFIKLTFFLDKNFYYYLAFAGLFYNLATWIDKFIFWFHPLTGSVVIGRLHSSVIYDLPVFLAYLSILPGMAIFFFRLETDFYRSYFLFYNTIREGGTLKFIKLYKINMIKSIRNSLIEILILQSIIDIIFYIFSPKLFSLLNIPQLYLGLLLILMIGTLLQLMFMSILSIFNYLDRKKEVMILSILFFVLNGLFTYISIYLGPEFFGYGYTISLLVVFSITILWLKKIMNDLDYETFMLQ